METPDTKPKEQPQVLASGELNLETGEVTFDTPDTELEKFEIKHCQNITDVGGFAMAKTIIDDVRNLLNSNTTYWKERLRREDEESYNRGYADAEHDVVERVRKEVEGMKEQCIKAYHGQTDIKEVFFYNQALDTLLDNLK